MACGPVLEAAPAAQAYPRPTACDLAVVDQVLQGLSRHGIGASASDDTRATGGLGRRELLELDHVDTVLGHALTRPSSLPRTDSYTSADAPGQNGSKMPN